MSDVVAFVSGKGGAGKTTLCSLIGYALSKRGKKTLIVELDSGLRGLDLILGVPDKTAYDLSDALKGPKELRRSIIRCDSYPGLSVICAAADPDYRAEQCNLKGAVSEIRGEYDFILFDAPAGVGAEVEAACAAADRTVVITTPDAVAVRDAVVLSNLLYEKDTRDLRLIINLVRTGGKNQNQIDDFDSIIDAVGARLLGVVPCDEAIGGVLCGGSLESGMKPGKAIDHIAARLCGEYVRLSIL